MFPFSTSSAAWGFPLIRMNPQKSHRRLVYAAMRVDESDPFLSMVWGGLMNGLEFVILNQSAVELMLSLRQHAVHE